MSERRNIEALCAAKGMRMTEQRRTIARVLADSDDHPDVEELYRRCAKIDEHIYIHDLSEDVRSVVGLTQCRCHRSPPP